MDDDWRDVLLRTQLGRKEMKCMCVSYVGQVKVCVLGSFSVVRCSDFAIHG